MRNREIVRMNLKAAEPRTRQAIRELAEATVRDIASVNGGTRPVPAESRAAFEDARDLLCIIDAIECGAI